MLDDVNFGEITQRNRKNGWTNGFEHDFGFYVPIEKFYEEDTQSIKRRMETMMRSHAEEMISDHFPDFLERRHPPRHFYFHEAPRFEGY